QGALPSCPAGTAAVHVTTFASQMDVGMSTFFASTSATVGQVTLLDYGLGASWGNLTIRLHALDQYLAQMLPAQQCDLVLLVDCYDSVIIGKADDIRQRLERLEAASGRAVFFGAETWKGDLVEVACQRSRLVTFSGMFRLRVIKYLG
ncbi:HEATR2, partial [Symbiodinium pilosum]